MKSDLPGRKRLASLEPGPKSKLPEQRAQPIADVGRIVGIALKLGLEGLFPRALPSRQSARRTGRQLKVPTTIRTEARCPPRRAGPQNTSGGAHRSKARWSPPCARAPSGS